MGKVMKQGEYSKMGEGRGGRQGVDGEKGTKKVKDKSKS